ncbi:MAG: chlorophyllide reductase [Mesorhizobium sp.]|uniref:chlorophyllide reductase n=1 Tax=Mesorhizobium sp. TaxID=1871066 RepID=UPI001AC1BA8B|nr:chlorophyllide reductase [Mesorhizobium sp.]MBN9217014.1 chlorophyllide reductase [Mesorhizobium sp.]
MPSFKPRIALATIAALVAAMTPFAAAALPSTATGQISVGQVIEMIDKADASQTARQTLVAYIAGVGETAGAIADTAKGSRVISCRKAFSLDTASVRAALETGAPRQGDWAQTPATPLIVADMLKRAGCRAMKG